MSGGRGLLQQPVLQALSAMVGYGGVEKMCQGVHTEEIQVSGVWMRLRTFTGSRSNRGPIQRHPSQMRQLDLLPLAEPMNPGFHPVMIRGHGDKNGKECSEGQVAAVIPLKSVEGNRADKANEENSQSPTCERCAGPDSLRNEAVGAPDNRLDLGDA